MSLGKRKSFSPTDSLVDPRACPVPVQGEVLPKYVWITFSDSKFEVSATALKKECPALPLDLSDTKYTVEHAKQWRTHWPDSTTPFRKRGFSRELLDFVTEYKCGSRSAIIHLVCQWPKMGSDFATWVLDNRKKYPQLLQRVKYHILNGSITRGSAPMCPTFTSQVYRDYALEARAAMIKLHDITAEYAGSMRHGAIQGIIHGL